MELDPAALARPRRLRDRPVHHAARRQHRHRRAALHRARTPARSRRSCSGWCPATHWPSAWSRSSVAGSATTAAASACCSSGSERSPSAARWSASRPTPGVLIVGRVLQGLAGGLVNPQVSGVVQQLFPLHERGRAFGAIGTAVGVATAAGPVVGGTIIALGGPVYGWRLCFLVNLPIGVTVVPPLPGLAAVPAALGPAAPASTCPARRCSRSASSASCSRPCSTTRAATPGWRSCSSPRSACSPASSPGSAARPGGAVTRSSTSGSSGCRSYAGGVALALLFFCAYTGTPLVLALFLQDGLGYSALHSGLTASAYAVGATCRRADRRPAAPPVRAARARRRPGPLRRRGRGGRAGRVPRGRHRRRRRGRTAARRAAARRRPRRWQRHHPEPGAVAGRGRRRAAARPPAARCRPRSGSATPSAPRSSPRCSMRRCAGLRPRAPLGEAARTAPPMGWPCASRSLFAVRSPRPGAVRHRRYACRRDRQLPESRTPSRSRTPTCAGPCRPSGRTRRTASCPPGSPRWTSAPARRCRTPSATRSSAASSATPRSIRSRSGLPQALAAFALERYGWVVDPGLVLPSGDVMAGVRFAVETLCDPAPVVVPVPVVPAAARRRRAHRAASWSPCRRWTPIGGSTSRAIDAAFARRRPDAAAQLAAQPARPGMDARGARGPARRRPAPRRPRGQRRDPRAARPARRDPRALRRARRHRGARDHGDLGVEGLERAGAQVRADRRRDPGRPAALAAAPHVANHGLSPLGLAATVAAYTPGHPVARRRRRARSPERRAELASLLDRQLPEVAWTPPEGTYLGWLEVPGDADPAVRARAGRRPRRPRTGVRRRASTASSG